MQLRDLHPTGVATEGDEEDVRTVASLTGGERHQHDQRAEHGYRFTNEPSCHARVLRQELFAVPFFPWVAVYVKAWSVAYSPGPAVSVTGTETPAFFASAFVRP